MLHRRNLPHLYFDEGIYFITYRLKNCIPLQMISRVPPKLVMISRKDFGRIIKSYDSVLNSPQLGINYLQIKEIAEICRETLHYPDNRDYHLICYTIMPNHIHLVFKLIPGNKGISKIMQSIKRVSASRSNKTLNRKGTFWQEESYDRWVRDEIELFFVIKYVLMNPVNAGLVTDWKDWEYTYCNEDYMVL